MGPINSASILGTNFKYTKKGRDDGGFRLREKFDFY